MLAAALLDLGLPESDLRTYLRDAGLGALTARLQLDQRNGIGGLHLDFVDDEGHPIDGVAWSEPHRLKATSTRGRRHPTPHLARTQKPAPKSAELSGSMAATDPNESPQAASMRALGPPMQGQNDSDSGLTVAPIATVPGDPVLEWLQAAEVPALDLLAFLRTSRLPPIAKAIAQKALRRALECLAQVHRMELERVVLDGRHAVDLLADVVSVASLLEILSPARVTASVVGISNAPVRIGGARVPGPSPWVMGALEGMPAREIDCDFETTTPTGAAVLWSVAHRFGLRDDFQIGSVGVGLGTHDPRTHANICRAMYGPPPPVETFSGQARAQTAQWLIALLGNDADALQLEQELLQCGATSLSWQMRQNAKSEAKTELSCAIPPEHMDAALEALYSAGCAGEVIVLPAVCRSPAQHVVTVQIGEGKRRPAIRVVERRFAQDRCIADPMEEDVRSAARALRIAPAQAKAMAWMEWSRKNTQQGATRRDGEEVKR